jgi:cell division protein FtsI/penicillin-binding protein 2
MLVSVVEKGHGKKAKVEGFSVAGKTGTAQVVLPGEKGYDEHKTIGTFVGFAPAYNPKFVALVRIDNPSTVQFAESTAAPAFGEIMRYLLDRFDVPPDREAGK